MSYLNTGITGHLNATNLVQLPNEVIYFISRRAPAGHISFSSFSPGGKTSIRPLYSFLDREIFLQCVKPLVYGKPVFSGYLKCKSNKILWQGSSWKQEEGLFYRPHLSLINIKDMMFLSLMSKATSVSLSLPTVCLVTASISLCISQLLFFLSIFFCFFYFCHPHHTLTEKDRNQTDIIKKCDQMSPFTFF